MNTEWDAIVIGSGIGGMTAAGLLAGAAGKRVLVLEKHSQPGGLTHVFRRDGASWDVGLHYVGEMEKGSMTRSIMDFICGGKVDWNRMPEDFERFVYPGIEFAVPSDPAEYQRRLALAFPAEAVAIRRYFRDINSMQSWNVMGFMGKFMPRPIGAAIGMVRRLGRSRATQTTKEYLDRHFHDPALKALLASQWGDYGLPPSQSAFAIHATIVGHYLKGAWFPEGGSGRIARAIESGIERMGGKVLVCQEAVAILTEGGKVTGVRVVDRRGSEPREVVYKAPIVISGMGARGTYERLLPTDGETGQRCDKIRRSLTKLAGGGSAVNLYLRLKQPVSTLGVKGENYWINTDLDHDSLEAQGRATLVGRPSHIYLSFPSAKSGETAFHTAEIIAYIDDKAFAAWKDKPLGNRGADYSALKETISDGLLDLAETALPGLKALVTYRELSTPLTVEHFTSHPGGRFYGLPATPARYKNPLPGPRTPLRGLYLAGCDAGSLGIVGAMMGGVGAAAQALGSTGFFSIMAAMSGKPTTPSAAASTALAVLAAPGRPSEKQKAVLTASTKLGPSVHELRFRLEAQPDWSPGQFARVRVADGEWRDYSIASSEGTELTLLVGTRTGGLGSRFAETALPGTETEIELPLGTYTLKAKEGRKVFVATGTGLAPFLPMFRELAMRGDGDSAELLFGCRSMAENLASRYASSLPGTTRFCVSREEPPQGGFRGRVTDALAELNFDPASTEFYLCGSAAMVADSRRVLERVGAVHIHTEAY